MVMTASIGSQAPLPMRWVPSVADLARRSASRPHHHVIPGQAGQPGRRGVYYNLGQVPVAEIMDAARGEETLIPPAPGTFSIVVIVTDAFVLGLLADLRRKNCWTIAEPRALHVHRGAAICGH
jgi:hypothetical protein